MYPRYLLYVTDKDTFMSSVFGADCFAANFPKLFDEPALTERGSNGWYYTIDKDGRRHDSSSFFTDEDIELCMKKVAVVSGESLEAIKMRLREFSIRTRDEATARLNLVRDSEAVLESIAVLCGAVHERRSKD